MVRSIVATLPWRLAVCGVGARTPHGSCSGTSLLMPCYLFVLGIGLHRPPDNRRKLVFVSEARGTIDGRLFQFILVAALVKHAS